MAGLGLLPAHGDPGNFSVNRQQDPANAGVKGPDRRGDEKSAGELSHDLLQQLFTLPYLKIDLVEKKGIAHRQTASVWLKKLTAAGLLKPTKKGKTTYYVNYRLMEILA